MNKAFLLPIIAIALVLSSCEKQEEIDQKVIDPILPTMDHISFSVDDNTLNFSTLDDYDLMLDYMSKLNKSLYPRFEEFVNIQSYRLYCSETGNEFPIDSELFLTLLNSEKSIIVGGHKFQYDFVEETVSVEDYYEGNQKSTPQVFSWAQDVVDIVFFNGPVSAQKGALISYCGTSTTSTSWSVTNSTVTAKIKNNKIPLYNELKANIDMSPNRSGIFIWVGVGSHGSMPPECVSYYETKKSCGEGMNGHDDGYYWERTTHIYGPSSKRLDGYDAWAQFLSTDEYQTPNETYTTILHKTCDVGAISCD